MKTIEDSNGNKYQQAESGTCYHIETSKSVIGILEEARNAHKRIRIFLGDTKTGKCWNEENGVVGIVGRSTGSIKIPLLIANSHSTGGGGLLDHCILKIIDTRTKTVLYKHELFNQDEFIPIPKSDLKQYTANVYLNQIGLKNIYARCKSMRSAERLAAFMNGTRMSK